MNVYLRGQSVSDGHVKFNVELASDAPLDEANPIRGLTRECPIQEHRGGGRLIQRLAGSRSRSRLPKAPW